MTDQDMLDLQGFVSPSNNYFRPGCGITILFAHSQNEDDEDWKELDLRQLLKYFKSEYRVPKAELDIIAQKLNKCAAGFAKQIAHALTETLQQAVEDMAQRRNDSCC